LNKGILILIIGIIFLILVPLVSTTNSFSTPTNSSPAGNTVDSSSKNFPSTISITDTMKPLSLEIGFDEVDD